MEKNPKNSEKMGQYPGQTMEYRYADGSFAYEGESLYEEIDLAFAGDFVSEEDWQQLDWSFPNDFEEAEVESMDIIEKLASVIEEDPCPIYSYYSYSSGSQLENRYYPLTLKSERLLQASALMGFGPKDPLSLGGIFSRIKGGKAGNEIDTSRLYSPINLRRWLMEIHNE